MAVELHSAETIFETAKSISLSCLDKYDSYFTKVSYNLNSVALNGQYEVLCGNVDMSSSKPTFNSYDRYVISVDNSKTPTSVTYLFQEKSESLVLNPLSGNQYFYYSNIKELHKPNYLKLKESVSAPPSNESTDITFPIDKNEFYLVPFLLAVLILMLFLKWTFPMKGGRNL